MNKFLCAVFSATIIILVFNCNPPERSKWSLQCSNTDDSKISWTKFTWASGKMGKDFYSRLAMFIPCRVNGIPVNLKAQFDLGSDVSMVYEGSIANFPEANRKIKSSSVFFWKKNLYFENSKFSFGDYTAINKNCHVLEGRGEAISSLDPLDTLIIGTIGADLLQNKVLLIDYPNQRFAICDEVPIEYNIGLFNIQLDSYGRVILPMLLKGKTYKVLFDNGSSIFPLLVSKEKTELFTKAPPTDTIETSSWGKLHNVIGRPLKDTFQLANQTFSNITIYTDFREGQNTTWYDGITGNRLFWDKTILIDFKNKKFGIK